MMSHAFPGRGVKCYFDLAALPLLLRNYYIKNSREPKISHRTYLLASFVYPSFSLSSPFFSLSPMMSQNPRKTVCCSKVIKEERSQEIHLAKYCIQKLLFSNTYSQSKTHLCSYKVQDIFTKGYNQKTAQSTKGILKVLNLLVK